MGITLQRVVPATGSRVIQQFAQDRHAVWYTSHPSGIAENGQQIQRDQLFRRDRLIDGGSVDADFSDCTFYLTHTQQQRFAERARQAGVELTLDVFPGQFHVIQTFSPLVADAQRAINRLGSFVRQRTQTKY
jgi:hypothetical protein